MRYPVNRVFHGRCLYLLLFFTFAGIAVHAPTVHAAHGRIFILHSYHHEYPWTNKQHNGFVQYLTTPHTEDDEFVFSSEYLDTKRKKFDEKYQQLFLRYLQGKYKDFHPEIIYSTDDNALAFLLKYKAQIFPEAPVVFSGVNNIDILQNLDPAQYTGVFEQKDIAANVRLAHKIEPESTIVFIGDNSPTYLAIKKNVNAEMKKSFPKSKYGFAEDSTLSGVVKSLKGQGAGVGILLTVGALVDDNQTRIPLKRLLGALAASAGDFTLLSTEDTYLYPGVIGGYVTSGLQQGVLAGKMVRRHLVYNVPIKDIKPIRKSPNQYIFDRQELKRRKVTLPMAVERRALILDEDQGLYERYKMAILIIFAVASIVFVGTILFFIISLSRKNRQIQHKNQELEKTSRELLENMTTLDEYKRAMDVSTIVTKTDLHGVITYANDAFIAISGYSREELIGRGHNIVRHPDTPRSVYQELWKTIMAKKIWKHLILHKAKDGSTYYLDTTIAPILDGEGEIKEFIAIRRDVSTLIRQEELIQRQTTDKLTGLPNRIKLFEDIATARNPHLALLDIDDFTEINNFYGPDIGDKVLVQSGLRISTLFPREQEWQLYRVAGDVFGLLKDNHNEAMEAIPEALRQLAGQPFCDGELEIHLNFTAGIVKGGGELYRAAEVALNAAKAKRKPFMFYDESLQQTQKHEQNFLWLKNLKTALADDKVVPYFQAIVRNDTGTLEKYECLVRLIEKNGKVASPFFFLDVAKRAKLYPQITRRMMEKSLEVFRDSSLEFSVNLAVEDILNPDTVSFLFDTIKKFGFARRLVLEITESEGFENFDEVLALTTRAKAMGCKIAIDDFGTGYSNFGYLLQIKPDYLKIDGSIIKNIDTDGSAQAIVETIVAFSRKLGIKTIAEFVHSQAVLEKVRELEVDYSQGYLLGEPIPKI